MTVCQSCLSCCAYPSITSQLLIVLFNTRLSNTGSSRQGYIDKMVKGEDMVELEYVIRSVYTKQQYIAKQPECMFHCYGTGSTRWKWLCTCMCMLKRDNKKRKKKSAGVIKFHTIMMPFMTVSHACHVCISINYLSVNYFTASHCALQHTFIKY